MATIQPFAYNPGGQPISGTTQSGDFAVGIPVTGFTGSPQFWNGPDEDLGYVIAQPVPAGNQPNPLGIPAYLGFFRSDGFSDSAFLNLVNSISGQNFANSLLAYSWLSDNGYYTDFIPITPTPTPTNTVTPSVTSTNTPTPTNTTTPTPTNTVTPSVTSTNTPTPTNTTTPTPTDMSSVTIYTISGCSSSNVLVAELLSPGLAPNDVFYLDFTGSTASECYKIINKVNDTPTDGSSPVTFYANCAECIDQTTTVYSISGCTNMVTLNADLLSPNLFPGDVFYIEFTGSTADGCYVVIEKIFNTVPTDTVLTNTFYGSCGSCEAAIVTPTPTNTPTLTETPTITPTPTNTGTPTNTPTPSTSPQPVTGYSFNLVATPYNFPSSGNSIMNNTGGLSTGSTEINVLATGGRGFYFNSFDTDGIDRTSYYSTFTGQSVTITFSQTGNTAIYSGDTNSFKQWIQAPTGSGFVFGANIGVPPSNTPSGAAVLVQSATTNYTIGSPVYVSLVIN